MAESKKGVELLKELQQMIADELGEKSSSRSFQPITEGLGLGSPQRSEMAAPLPPLTEDLRRAFQDSNVSKPVKPSYAHNPVERMFSPPPAKMPPIERRPELTLDPLPPIQAPAELPKKTPASVVEPMPPEERPASSVGTARRFFAFIIDQVFIWTTWLFALVATLKVLMGQNGIQLPTTGSFQDPLFIRFALVEFATLWLAYLSIGIGILDMTFGMWVWGIRVRYEDASGDNRFIQKALRIVGGFFFYGTVLPGFLLIFRRKGRNLLDLISGTSLYRTMV